MSQSKITDRPVLPYRRITLSRRGLLGSGSGLIAGAALTGCSLLETAPVQRDGDGAPNPSGPKGPEAPSLAAQVEAGKLPPVKERMPEQPLVVEPIESVGRYGGTWHSAMITQEDASWLGTIVGYEPLVRWTREWTNSAGTDEIIPNICEAFEELEGGKVFEFTLRKGLRWSDGEPCTAEDFRFAFEDVNVYADMHPGGFYDLWLSPDTARPGEFTVVDEQKVRYTFTAPKPGFLNELASMRTMVMPKHYFQEFHPRYNKNVDDLVKKANLNDWIQLFENKSTPWMNADAPTLNAWRLVTPLGEGTAVVAERNPYYWKTDPEGSQLPYIDKIQCEVLLDVEVELLKIANGELDLQMRNFSTVRNKPVVARNQEKGDYRMFTIGATGTNTLVIGFNQTLSDDRKRAIYANKDFRVGLSYAINRQRIIDSVYAGQGKPWQGAPLEGDPVYDEEFGTQFLEYSTDKANEALDQAGYEKRDSDNYRLADGQRIVVPVVVSSEMPDHVDALELIKADWQAVGVELQAQRVSETLYWERVEANQAEASTWTGGGFEIRATQGSNHYFLPSNPRGSSRYGHTWALWYRSEGAEGEEPPAPVKRQLELFDQMRVTYEADQATKLGKEIITIAKELFVYIGISTPPELYGIVKNSMKNVPDFFPGSVGYMAPGPSNPEHFYFTA
ncbi:ABC transporter substrate-binding protein [Microlunatus parietis]|uniref:Peptide/nickel transport system substrate-binding protein n=1 Tax=Microlunatus parietis TaxID=682979 RepID=A0A7Y9I614_9ACTN|nr:ABC transporter substrate-binding protein [Microlunatus parietis]NYE70690.1 peptide/nickel transport system substrate-binding protein [Microlunatus parietis]